MSFAGKNKCRPPERVVDAEQKGPLKWLGSMVSGVGLVISGMVLWFPEYVPWNLQWIKFLAILLHAACAFVSIGGLMIHLYMGIFLVKGGFGQIVTGEVTRAWAYHHHRLWLTRVTKDHTDG